MNGIAARVEAGAAWLDEHRPGWVDRINLDTLDLGDPCGCILGQEFNAESMAPGATRWNGYAIALEWLEDYRATQSSKELAADLGMHSANDLAKGSPHAVDMEYVALTEMWRELILARRGAR